jgi:hypothetical protein
MTAKAKARANKMFIVQASLMLTTYDCQNIFIVQATAVAAKPHKGLLSFSLKMFHEKSLKPSR